MGVRGGSVLRWEVQLRHEIWLQQEEEISPETRVESILTQHLQTSSGAATISSSGGTLEKQLNVWDNTITCHHYNRLHQYAVHRCTDGISR